jgi:hypothetical protein
MSRAATDRRIERHRKRYFGELVERARERDAAGELPAETVEDQPIQWAGEGNAPSLGTWLRRYAGTGRLSLESCERESLAAVTAGDGFADLAVLQFAYVELADRIQREADTSAAETALDAFDAAPAEITAAADPAAPTRPPTSPRGRREATADSPRKGEIRAIAAAALELLGEPWPETRADAAQLVERLTSPQDVRETVAAVIGGQA